MLWVTLLLACSTPAPVPSRPTVTELPPFEDPAIEIIYHRLAAWADGLGWTSNPLRSGGTSLDRTWIRGDPGKGKISAPGTARVELSVFAYRKPKSSYGLAWSAGVTDEVGQGVRLLVVSGGRDITPDQVRIDLKPVSGALVELGAPLTWDIGEGGVHTRQPEGLAEVQAKWAAYQGPSFAAQAERDLRDLELAARAVLDMGDYWMCDHGPLPGGGLPQECRPRRPTEAERQANHAAFYKELARLREVLGDGAIWLPLLESITPPL